jgi:hypothetical protein
MGDGADEVRMVELDIRTARLALLLGAFTVVVVLAAVVPHQAGEITGLAVGLGALTVCWLKGKRGLFVLSFLIPFVPFIGAIRLAKPNSYWAARWYDAEKMERAEQRFARSRRALPDPN